MQHNLLIVKPGSLEKVGNAADLLARESNAIALNYVPKMPEVLHATELVSPGRQCDAGVHRTRQARRLPVFVYGTRPLADYERHYESAVVTLKISFTI